MRRTNHSLRHRILMVGLCLSLLLTGLLPAAATNSRPRFVTTGIAPGTESIGMIEASGTALIDGQAVSGRQPIRGGEVIQTAPGAHALVTVAAAGEVRLGGSATARLALSSPQRLMVASIISGTVSVKLQPDASALVQIGNAQFTALGGAGFTASLSDGRVMIDADHGIIWNADKWAIRRPGLMNTEPGRSGRNAAGKATAFDHEKLLRSIRLMSSAAPVSFDAGGIIGHAESLRAMTINGHLTGTRAEVRNGETWQASAEAGLRITLNELGRVSLTPGSAAKLAAGITGRSEDAVRRVLSASLISGEMQLKLLPQSFTLIQSGGLLFTVFGENSVRVTERTGHTVIEAAEPGVSNWSVTTAEEIIQTVSQAAQAAGQLPHRYFVRPVGLTNNITVRQRGTRMVQIQVTDENDRKVPDLPVLFTLSKFGGNNLGTLNGVTTITAKTNAEGVASVPFKASNTVGAQNITATVEGANSTTWVGTINVIRFVPGFWAPQNALPILGTAATISVIAPIAISKQEDKTAIKASGPPVIRP
ncbi:MAG: hypothetical protein U0Z53_02765 [Blastocatellia bacterium]